MTTSIFGNYCVDAWSMYRWFTTDSLHPNPKLDQQEFYSILIEEFVGDNNICQTRKWTSTRVTNEQQDTAPMLHDSINLDHGLQVTPGVK